MLQDIWPITIRTPGYSNPLYVLMDATQPGVTQTSEPDKILVCSKFVCCLVLLLFVQCDGQDFTAKIRELKFHCLLFLNIPKYVYNMLLFVFSSIIIWLLFY